MSTRQRAVNLALVAAVAGLAATGIASVGNPAKAKAVLRTAAVQQGDVQATVSATGNVSVPTSLALNFTTGGKVTEIDVKAGDHVTTGQTLAKVDDSAARSALAAAQANLRAAQLRLDQSQHPLTAAQAAVNAASAAQAAAAVANAKTALADVQQMLAANALGYQNAVDSAQNQLATDQNQLQVDQAQLQHDKDKQQQDQAAGNAAPADDQAVAADQQRVNSDNQAVTKDQNALAGAKTAQAQGQAKDQQTLDQAQAQVSSAEASYASTLANNALKAAPPLPGDLAASQASITSAQNAVTTATQALDGTVLTAPADGTVASVNGVVGGTASGGGAGTSSSSGSSSSSSSSSGSPSSSSSSSGTSTGGFVTLVDLNSLDVRTGFSETDAAKLQVGQPATVTFPALPGQEVAAHVIAIDATSTVVSNVVTYTATLVVDNPASQLKPGMSANVSVVVARADNVLHVPTAAVRGSGAAASVTLMKAGKPSSVPVTVGVVGDDSDEIDSGLAVGDVVVVSSGSASTSLPGRTGGGFGGGGFGGGGLGGGGLGGRGN